MKENRLILCCKCSRRKRRKRATAIAALTHTWHVLYLYNCCQWQYRSFASLFHAVVLFVLTVIFVSCCCFVCPYFVMLLLCLSILFDAVAPFSVLFIVDVCVIIYFIMLLHFPNYFFLILYMSYIYFDIALFSKLFLVDYENVSISRCCSIFHTISFKCTMSPWNIIEKFSIIIK